MCAGMHGGENYAEVSDGGNVFSNTPARHATLLQDRPVRAGRRGYSRSGRA